MVDPLLWGWSTTPITITFWGWEDAAGLANIITGVSRVVHAPVQAWKVVQGTPVSRVVPALFIPKAVYTSFIPTVSRVETISKVVLSRETGKVIRDERISRVQAVNATGKAVMGSGVPKVQYGSAPARVIRVDRVGRVGRVVK